MIFQDTPIFSIPIAPSHCGVHCTAYCFEDVEAGEDHRPDRLSSVPDSDRFSCGRLTGMIRFDLMIACGEIFVSLGSSNKGLTHG
jgi:hypothetical protein